MFLFYRTALIVAFIISKFDFSQKMTFIMAISAQNVFVLSQKFKFDCENSMSGLQSTKI